MKIYSLPMICALVLISSMAAKAEELSVSRPGCPTDKKLLALQGTIESATDPATEKYYANENCSWDISLIPEHQIIITVVYFELEKRNKNSQCMDYVLLNGERYCGVRNPNEKWAFEKDVRVQFVTDNLEQMKGFKIEYTQKELWTCKPPCYNGGICMPEMRSCHCLNGYGGFRCSYETTQENSLIVSEAEENLPTQDNCAIYGHKNIRTFDGYAYHLGGSCEYALSEFGHIKVAVKMRNSSEYGVSGIKSISVTTGGVQKIVIVDGLSGKKVVQTETGRVLKLPDFYGPYEITNIYQRIRVRDDDFVLEVDEDGAAATLVVKSNHNGSTEGLCGNYNGMPDDELKTPEGLAARDVSMLELAWRQDETCSDSTKDIPLDGYADEVKSVCNQLRTAQFAQCVERINPAKYIAACEEDMRLCAYETQPDCMCASFTQYARDCVKAKNIRTLDWRNGRCEKQCPGNQSFSECAPFCPRTCKSLGVDYNCPDTCIDGCTCPEGFYWNDHECVEASHCPCHVGSEVYSSASTIEDDCQVWTDVANLTAFPVDIVAYNNRENVLRESRRCGLFIKQAGVTHIVAYMRFVIIAASVLVRQSLCSRSIHKPSSAKREDLSSTKS